MPRKKGPKRSKRVYVPKRGAFYRSLQNQVDNKGENLNIVKEDLVEDRIQPIKPSDLKIKLKVSPNIWSTVA